MKKIYISLFFTISFLAWVFYPVLFFEEDMGSLPASIILEDRYGDIITDKGNENGYYKHLKNLDINSKFISSLIRIEDKNYFTHIGVDILAKFRAIRDNLSAGRVVSGGSSIVEQYIKNKYFEGYERTYIQKLREFFLAIYMDTIYSKEQILKLYLDSLYLGNNIYGLQAGMEVYFGVDDIDKLSDEQIVLIIALIRNPSVSYLGEENFSDYLLKVKNKLGFEFEKTINKLNRKEYIDKYPFVTSRLLDGKSSREIYMKSSIDSTLSDYTNKIVNKTLDEFVGKNVTNAGVIMINPKNMEVLVYEGSRGYNSTKTDGQVDVINSLRQFGSTLKPFLYLFALESGANPDDYIVDLENSYNTTSTAKYHSQNYSLKEYGIVKLKKALGNSLNNATLMLAREIGLERVYSFFKEYGIELVYPADYYGYSMVLGNPTITLENLVLSYINLIPGFEVDTGRKLSFELVGEDKYGDSEIDANKFLLYDILSDPDNRDVSFGVNSMLNSSIYQAVKTGTSTDFRDNVVVSYSPDLVIGVWVGNNDNSNMIGVTGISGAGYIWHQVVEKAISMGYIEDRSIDKPDGINETYNCIDRECLRKEIIYKKGDKSYKSIQEENTYYLDDIYIGLGSEEIKRLEDMGYRIKN